MPSSISLCGAPRAIPGSIDHYRLLRPLGSGGAGIVCEAQDTRLGQRVAVKLIPHKSAGGADAQQILREARIFSAVRHPHVVSVYDTGAYSGGTYLVLELMDAGSAQALLRDGRLPWRHATAILVAACEGLMAAHARGIIHCDIKPANILLRRDEGRGMKDEETQAPRRAAGCPRPFIPHPSSFILAKIADFGLARWLDPSKTPTAWKRMSGTPHFMSPEQCREEECDERTDIYSLGATYHALLTGLTPYAEGTPARIMFDHCSAPAPDPRAVHREIPSACAEIVRRAMAKKRTDRNASVREMQTALRALLSRRS